MNFDPINSWVPPVHGSDSLQGLQARNKKTSPSTTQREVGHVPVDRADAEKREREATSNANKSAFERIVEKGFSKFMEEMEVEKRKKLREKILGAMGLTEEMLAKMSPEQRAQVEKAVAEEIRRRLTAAAEINAQEKQAANAQNMKANGISPSVNNLAMGPTEDTCKSTKAVGMGRGMGLGPLLALQEVASDKGLTADNKINAKPGQNDRDEG